MRQAAQLGVLQMHLSGGEPTARRDLEEIVTTAAEVGLYTNLITAGVLLKRDRLEKLKECGLDHVQISIQDVDTRPRTPTASAATRAAAPRRRKWPAGCASSACR